jgi:uncharacterized membrane protein YhaH (DUF805 family)
MMIGITELLIVALLLIIILPVIFLYAPIIKKAGFSGWWSILLLVPYLNIGVVWLFSFIDWPVEKSVTESNGKL